MTNLIPFFAYTDADDSFHPVDSRDYYEWWYNDFHFDNGWAAVAVWHYRDWLKKPRVPSVEISIYDPAGKRYYHETVIATDKATASETQCDVRIGNHHFWQENGGYRLVVDAKGISADLTMRRSVPPLFIPAGLIYEDNSNQHYWCVPVPRGNATGEISVDNHRMPVNGVCYHDHNWGTCDMNENFGGWTWGRFFDPVYSGIFSYSFLINPETANPAEPAAGSGIIYLAKNDMVILCSEKVNMDVAEEVFDEPTGQTMPRQLVLSAAEDNCSISCHLTVQRIIERDHLKFAGWKTHNWRYLDDYRAEITLDGQKDVSSGQTLHERFLLRLK